MKEATRNEHYAGTSQRAIALLRGIHRKSVFRLLRKHQDRRAGGAEERPNSGLAPSMWKRPDAVRMPSIRSG